MDILTKKCSKCKTEKTESEFSWKNKAKGTKQGVCKECASKKTLSWYKEKREEINNRRRGRYDPIKNKNTLLKSKYGITLEDYERIWAEQNGKCPICDMELKDARQVDLDHNHTTLAVRGILCNTCNLMIGHARDDSTRLKKGAEYLQRYE